MADPVDDSQDQYLQSVLQGSPGPSDDGASQVSGISVAPQANPSGQQGTNYQAPDLAASANNVKSALNDPAFQPQGGGANPGVWGLLPQGMQHGTLRNVLGALGDAFLVGSGHQAQYEPRMERQQEGLAFASHAEHPELSNGLMAATGTPDAMKNVVSLQENQNNVDARKAQLEATAQYRQESLDQRKDNQTALAQSRSDNQIRALMPQIGGLASRAQTPEDYTKAYTQAEAIAQRVGPNYHASDFGLLDPSDWKPGMTQGTTGGQQLNDAAKTAQRGVSVSNNRASNASRIQAASIGAGQRASTAAAGMGERDARLLNAASANNGAGLASMSPTDQARVQYLTTKGSGKTTPTLTPSAAAAANAGPKAPSVQMGQPTNGDVAKLRSNPALRASFEQHFGQGAAAKYLGK